jgi:hypothetical protein
LGHANATVDARFIWATSSTLLAWASSSVCDDRILCGPLSSAGGWVGASQ